VTEIPLLFEDRKDSWTAVTSNSPSHAGVNRVAVAEDVVHAGDKWLGFEVGRLFAGNAAASFSRSGFEASALGRDTVLSWFSKTFAFYKCV
jgi:hypothetical protein